MAVSLWGSLASKFDTESESTSLWASPGAMAQATNPATVQTPALKIIDEALVEAFNTPDSRLIITMAPQEGKSVRVANDFPVWCLTQNQDLRIVTASYGQNLANRNGRAIRNRITAHPELGLKIAKDNGSVSEWTLEGREGGVLSVGIGAGVTGRAADMLIIDDPVKDRKEADSETYRDNVWDWWTDAASARLAPGAPVVIILTRWHMDDLAGRLLEKNQDAGWKIINIPAQANHRPELGETDVLGREPGEFMVSARGRTQKQWEQRKLTAGAKTWASLYQGNPTPDDGDVFPKEEHWARYSHQLAHRRDDGSMWVAGMERDDQEMLMSWDLAFKDKDTSDYVVGQVWLRVGNRAYLLDQVRERYNFTKSVSAFKRMVKRWPQAIAKLVEDKANGPALINVLQNEITGIIPVEPLGSKYARASAIAPLVEAGNVVLPTNEILPGVDYLFQEAVNFPNVSHDDTVDAMSQAINQLLNNRLDADEIFDAEEYDRPDEQGFYLSAF